MNFLDLVEGQQLQAKFLGDSLVVWRKLARSGRQTDRRGWTVYWTVADRLFSERFDTSITTIYLSDISLFVG